MLIITISKKIRNNNYLYQDISPFKSNIIFVPNSLDSINSAAWHFNHSFDTYLQIFVIEFKFEFDELFWDSLLSTYNSNYNRSPTKPVLRRLSKQFYPLGIEGLNDLDHTQRNWHRFHFLTAPRRAKGSHQALPRDHIGHKS